MSERKIFFIGSFPGIYGGQTIKTQTLYNVIKKQNNVEVYNTTRAKKDLLYLLKMPKFLICNKNKKGVICLANDKLEFLTRLLKKNKVMMNNITVFIVGGVFSEYLTKLNKDVTYYNEYKNIIVETEMMKSKLEVLGIRNVKVMANFREYEEYRKFYSLDIDKNIRFAFISQISKEKGIDTVIDAVNLLRDQGTNITVDFFGHIAEKDKEYFEKNIDKEVIVYKGIIKNNKEVIDKLSKYHALLLPTRYPNEGLPGIFAEAKIAGIPIITTNINYNTDIVNNGVDGIIMEDGTSESLVKAIKELIQNKSKYDEIRYNSYLDGEKYLAKTYINEINSNLLG